MADIGSDHRYRENNQAAINLPAVQAGDVMNDPITKPVVMA
jgi:hypothetical protein